MYTKFLALQTMGILDTRIDLRWATHRIGHSKNDQVRHRERYDPASSLHDAARFVSLLWLRVSRPHRGPRHLD